MENCFSLKHLSGYFKMIFDLWISDQWRKYLCKVLNLNSNILLTLSRFCVPYSVQWLLFVSLLHYVPLENISLMTMKASPLSANGCEIEGYAEHILCLSRAGRDVCCITSSVTPDLGFRSLIRWTAPIS